MSYEIKGTIIAKAGNGKGFKISTDQEKWYTATDITAPYLAKMNKGDEVVVIYEKKGVSHICTKIMKAEAKAVEPTPAPTASSVSTPKTYTQPFVNKTGYGSPEDVAGKEVGCAAGCAANILSGRQEDVDTLIEMFRVLTNGILEHIRSLK